MRAHLSRCWALSAFVCASLASSARGQEPVRWRAGVGPAAATAGPTDAAADVATGAAAVSAVLAGELRAGGGRHVVVHLDGAPRQHTRRLLERAGVRLARPLGGGAFFAYVRASELDVSALSNVAAFRGVQAIDPAWKLHASLAGSASPPWSLVDATDPGDPRVAVLVLLHAGVPLAASERLAQDWGAEIVDRLESVGAWVLELPRSALSAVVATDEVQWVEPPLPPLSDVANDSNSALTQADVVQAAPYGLDGSGVGVLVYDGGTARGSHDDFGGRLAVRDSSGLSNHATHVSGTIGGDGSASGGSFEGMAPGVTIESYGFEYDGTSIFLYTNPGDLETDYDEAIHVHGADLANNSISTNTEINGFPCNIQGDYGVTAALIDAIVRGSLGAPFRIVWAAGNERQGDRCDVEGFGDYYSVAPPATAKNHLTVGALNSNNDSMTSFSTWGPTDDGRLKPDVSAPGCQSNGDGGVTSPGSSSDTAYSTLCGTSMASPTVTGLCALLLEDYRAQFGGPDPLGSTFKVLLAHTAADGGNAGPDYQFGYGSVRIQAAVDLMRQGFFREDSLDDDGAVYAYTVNVSGSDPELVLTLAWDDAPGTPNVMGSLVNDLDLRLLDPMGNQHFPWTLDPADPGAAAVQDQLDRVNNLEQIHVDSPAAGAWRVEVHAFELPSGPQTFSIASSHALSAGPFVQIGFPTPLPVAVAPGVPTAIRARIVGVGESVVGGSPTLHYRFDGGPFQALTMAAVGGDEYEAELPAPFCGDAPELYVSAQGDTSGTAHSPPGAPAASYAVVVEDATVLFSDDFETDTGWSVQDVSLTDGGWERGVPAGDGDRNDPLQDFDGSGSCYLTDNVAGNSDVDGGPTRLTSPALDLSGPGEHRVHYARWFANDDFDADALDVEVSNDGGGSWVTVESAGNTSGWEAASFRVADYVAPTADVRVRFSAVDDPNDSITEAAIDAFRVVATECVDLAPIGEFSASATSGTAPLEVDFTDLSTGTVTGWSWDFGDGATSSDANPSHTYELPGTFTVSLTVSGPAGSDVETKSDYVTAQLPPAVGVPYGTGTAGSLGIPTMGGYSELVPGSPLYLVAGNMPAALPAFVGISVSASIPPLDLSNGLLLNLGIPILVVSPHVTDAAGEAIFRLNLTPLISGISVFGQAFCMDGTGGDDFAVSRGLEVDLP